MQEKKPTPGSCSLRKQTNSISPPAATLCPLISQAFKVYTMIVRITQLFPVWAVLFSVVAYLQPALFNGLSSGIVPLLTTIMLAMALTLTPADFVNVARHKSAITIRLVLPFSVMPLLAVGISLELGF